MHGVPPLAGVAVVCSAAIGAACPLAAASWSAPTAVSGAHALIELGSQIPAAPGAELLSWRQADGSGAHRSSGASFAVAQPGGRFGRERRLPYGKPKDPTGAVSIVDLGAGHVAELIVTQSGATRTAAVALGRSSGAFAAPERVAVGLTGFASLAGNAHGDLVLAWISGVGGRGRRVFASVRPRGGRFGAPEVLSSAADAEQVKVAVGGQGDMVAAFASRRGRELARVRRHRGAWGPTQNLGPASRGNENDATPFVGDSGEVLLAWFSVQLCEGGCSNPGYTRVAVAPARTRRFRAAQALEQDPISVPSPTSRGLEPLILASSGRASMIVFAATSATSPAAPVVKVAYRDGLGFGAPQTISPAGQYPGGIRAATGPPGAIVTWSSMPFGMSSRSAVFAAVLDRASGRFGAPEQVSPDSENAYQALPTFNPGSDWPANPIPPWTIALVTAPAGSGPRHQTVVSVTTPVCAPTPDPACLGA